MSDDAAHSPQADALEAAAWAVGGIRLQIVRWPSWDEASHRTADRRAPRRAARRTAEKKSAAHLCCGTEIDWLALWSASLLEGGFEERETLLDLRHLPRQHLHLGHLLVQLLAPAKGRRGGGWPACTAPAETAAVMGGGARLEMKLRPWVTLTLTASAACCAVSRYTLMYSAVLSVICRERQQAQVGWRRWRSV